MERRNGSRWRVADKVWFWLVASNLFFLVVYLVRGAWDVLRIPAR